MAGIIRLWLIFWRFSPRRLIARPGRTLAVVLGVALGAAAFASVRMAADASLDAFSDSMRRLSGNADFQALLPGGRLPDEAAARLWRTPGVAAVSPVVTAWVRPDTPAEAYDPFAVQPLRLIGVDPLMVGASRGWLAGARTTTNNTEQARGLFADFLAKPGAAVLGARAAAQLGVRAGDSFRLASGASRGAFHVLAVVDDSGDAAGLAAAEGGRAVIVDVATAQEFLGLRGLDRLDVTLAPGASSGTVQEALRALLPVGAVLRDPGESAAAGQGLIESYRLNLSVLGFTALAVGMFLVYGLCALHAAARRGEAATLAALGGSPALIFGLFLGEGALLGLAGWLVGMPVAVLLARALTPGIGGSVSTLFATVWLDGPSVTPERLALSFAATLTASLAAAWIPARQAQAAPPREALLPPGPGGRTGERRAARRLFALGLALIAVSELAHRTPALLNVPEAAAYGFASVFALFAGFALLAPWLIVVFGRLSGALGRLGGVPAFLAARFAAGASIRVAASVGALVTAAALFVSLDVMIHSFRNTFSAWVNQSLAGDVYLRSALAEMNEYAEPLAPEIVEWLRSRKDVESLAYRRFYLGLPAGRTGGRPYQFEAQSADVLERRDGFLFLEAPGPGFWAEFAAGRGVVVSEVFATQSGLGVGDRYRARVGGQELELPVLAVVRSYRTRGGVVFFSLAAWQALSGDQTWSGARVFFTDRAALDAQTERFRAELLARFGERHTLESLSGAQLRGAIERIFEETFSVTTGLLLIALAVAGLGVAVTMAVLVIERSKELSVLLAVGASPGQVGRMVVWEAGCLAGLGVGLGLVCGLALSRLLVFVVNRASFGWTFAWRLDATDLALGLPLILLASLAAALPAARHAALRPPALALKEK